MPGAFREQQRGQAIFDRHRVCGAHRSISSMASTGSPNLHGGNFLLTCHRIDDRHREVEVKLVVAKDRSGNHVASQTAVQGLPPSVDSQARRGV
jgi:hypothetical protein